MKVNVIIREFEFSHGKKPRGFGSWAFWMGTDTSDIMKAQFFMGTFTEASRQAAKMAKDLGFTAVTVGS